MTFKADASHWVTAEQREAKALEAAWAALRAERDRRISATDWVILRNLETAEPVPQVWLDYRQTLRDLPASTTNPANPDWPEMPTV